LKDAPEKVQGTFIDCVFNQLKSTYPPSVVATIQSEVKAYVLAETNLSCDHFFPGTSSESKPTVTAGYNKEDTNPSSLDQVEGTVDWDTLEIEESVELEEIDEMDDFIGDLMSTLRPSPKGKPHEDNSTILSPIQIPEEFVIKQETVSPTKSNESPSVTKSMSSISSNKPRARICDNDKNFEPPKKVN